MVTVDLTISPAMKAFLIHHWLMEAVMEMEATLRAGLLNVAHLHCENVIEINLNLYRANCYSESEYEEIKRCIFDIYNAISDYIHDYETYLYIEDLLADMEPEQAINHARYEPDWILMEALK